MTAAAILRAPSVLPCAHVKIGRSVGYVMLGGPVYRIQGETGDAFVFEWHPMFGPARCNAKGDVMADTFGPRSKFWQLLDRWLAGGKQITEDGCCVLADAAPSCDETCPDCAGRGWYRLEGDRRKHACYGPRNRVVLNPAGQP